MDSTKTEYRILIKYFYEIGEKAADIHRRLKQKYGCEAPTDRTVRYWVERFRENDSDIGDKPRSGRPKTGQSDKNIRKVSAVLDKDRRLTLDEICSKTRIPRSTVVRIIDGLGLRLKCARWIPKILTPEQKKLRISAAKENIFLHNMDSDFFESHIVTGDETYIHHYEPETKRQSKQWLPSGSGPPKKAIRKLSAKKVMALVFWDKLGVLLVKFFRKGETMTGAKYAKILEELRRAIQKKRKNLWDEGIFLLHDNASSHTSNISKTAITELGFVKLDHPPYSPDLAPSDYFLFPNLKKDLRKNTYSSDAHVENFTKRWFLKKPDSFYSNGISRLRHRWEKCITVKGEYVEK